jgi:hypothetical protein
MRTEHALKFFGTKTKLAKAAGIELQSFYKWGELVPEARARRLEEASGGVLHYDKDVYDQYRKAKRLEKQTNTPGA